MSFVDPAGTPGTTLPHRPVVLVAGATGLVGGAVVRRLMADPLVGEVRALVRRPVAAQTLLACGDAAEAELDRLRIVQVDFDQLEAHKDAFAVDWVVCALGTTLRQAGSRDAFRQVDFHHALAVLRVAREQGAPRAAVVSAVGADAGSAVFYNRTKGQLEQAVQALRYPHTTVARPSLLEGPREVFRPAERLGLALGFLLPDAYKPVRAEQVAAGMLSSLRAGAPGWHVLNNTALRAMR